MSSEEILKKNMDIFSDLLDKTQTQYLKGQEYFKLGELEGALISYIQAAQYMDAARKFDIFIDGSDNDDPEMQEFREQYKDIDNVLAKILGKIRPLQEELRRRKLMYSQRKSSADDDDDLRSLNCKNVRNLVFTNSKDCITFSDVAGLDTIKRDIENAFVYPLIYPKLYPKIAKGMLLYGTPGSGKSFIAKAAVNELQLRDPTVKVLFFAPTAAELKSKYVGETEKNIKRYFRCASKHAKTCKDRIADGNVISILFFDEFDAIASSRRDDETGGVMINSVNTLLQMLDGIENTDNVSIIAATNFPWKLDTAILRRFTKQVMVGLPTTEAIVDILVNNINSYVSLNAAELNNGGSSNNDDSGSNSSTPVCENKCNALIEKHNARLNYYEAIRNDEELSNDMKRCIDLKLNDEPLYKQYSSYISINEDQIKAIAVQLYRNRYSASDVNNVSTEALIRCGERARKHGVFYDVSNVLFDNRCERIINKLYMSTLSLPDGFEMANSEKLKIIKPPEYSRIVMGNKVIFRNTKLEVNIDPISKYAASTASDNVYYRDNASQGAIQLLYSVPIRVILNGSGRLYELYIYGEFKDMEEGKSVLNPWNWFEKKTVNNIFYLSNNNVAYYFNERFDIGSKAYKIDLKDLLFLNKTINVDAILNEEDGEYEANDKEMIKRSFMENENVLKLMRNLNNMSGNMTTAPQPGEAIGFDKIGEISEIPYRFTKTTEAEKEQMRIDNNARVISFDVQSSDFGEAISVIKPTVSKEDIDQVNQYNRNPALFKIKKK